ncbi:Enzyme that catalyzes the fourth step in the histidine pathway [Blyttiomyces sp. JEL0837]|nr:Enzyme that catalyzes the fourth step in the histidine pathway [Blyttiomyces sp. JEL0837]
MTSSTTTTTPPAATLFRPCIDLHDGQVKQIVGATLTDNSPADLRTNFVSREPPEYYANLYKKHRLLGGHVIKLGPNNDAAARTILSTWPNTLQIGGGIDINNASEWLDAGAGKVIITSYLFPNGKFSEDRLKELSTKIGKDRLVVDVSCKAVGYKWVVAMNKWQTLTDMEVNQESITLLEQYCSEFLVHAADVEGLCKGIDEKLVEKLGSWCSIPVTYAGGGHDISDLALVERLSHGKVDLTFGSALDIFGGNKVMFEDCIKWNAERNGAIL